MHVRWNESEKRWVVFIKTDKKTWIFHYHAIHGASSQAQAMVRQLLMFHLVSFFPGMKIFLPYRSACPGNHIPWSAHSLPSFFPGCLDLATSMNSQGHQRQQFRFNSTDKFESTMIEQGGLDVHNHVSGLPWCIRLMLVCASDPPYKSSLRYGNLSFCQHSFVCHVSLGPSWSLAATDRLDEHAAWGF